MKKCITENFESERSTLRTQKHLLNGLSLIVLSHLNFPSRINKVYSILFIISDSHPQVGRIRKTAARRREYHILFMVLTTAACYLLCWMPYGVVAMMATFGPPNIISPVASVVPSLLAKSSTVINPLIYILMNKQVSQGDNLTCTTALFTQ